MRILIPILCLFVFSCDDNPTIIDSVAEGCTDETACNYWSSAEVDDGSCEYADCCDVDDFNDDGYYCGDFQVLQDFIDANPSLDGLSPLDLSYHEWDENGRLIHLNLKAHPALLDWLF